MGEALASDRHRAELIDLDLPTDLRRIGVSNGIAVIHAGVVDHHVDTTKGVHRPVDQRRHRRVVGDVGGDHEGGFFFEVGGHVVQPVLPPGRQRHGAALFGQPPCGGGPDSRGGTRHDRHPISEAHEWMRLKPMTLLGHPI